MLRKANKTGLASAVAVFLLVPAMARANLLLNPSFEDGTGYYTVDHWEHNKYRENYYPVTGSWAFCVA